MGDAAGEATLRLGAPGEPSLHVPHFSHPQWLCSGGPAGRRACPSLTGARGWKSATAAAAWTATETAARCAAAPPALCAHCPAVPVIHPRPCCSPREGVGGGRQANLAPEDVGRPTLLASFTVGALGVGGALSTDS